MLNFNLFVMLTSENAVVDAQSLLEDITERIYEDQEKNKNLEECKCKYKQLQIKKTPSD